MHTATKPVTRYWTGARGRGCLGALLLGLALAAAAPAPVWADACLPAGYDAPALIALKGSGWQIEPQARATLAEGLIACIGAANPAVRDGWVFEGLQHWLRHDQLDVPTRTRLLEALRPLLFAPDAQYFTQPFAALVLAELARSDRMQPYLGVQQRQTFLDASIAYLESVRDYRGFDAEQGWRHGVAHGADLLLQLALNPHVGHAALVRMAAALATQVAPPGHFYVYGESDRLARAAMAIGSRGQLSAQEWTAHFAVFGTRADAFSSQQGLAWRHNLKAYVQALVLAGSLQPQRVDAGLLAAAHEQLARIP